MAFELKDKTIWIFSPEQWTNMRLSKHHYASALARLGNKVFFIEPGNKTSRQVQLTEVEPNLQVVNYPLMARGWGKLPYLLYRIFMKREINFLKRNLGGAPDVAWCFDPLRLTHLNALVKSICIYHPVDQFDETFLALYPIKTKIAFTTMPVEVEKLRRNGFEAFFITHGLNPAFSKIAATKLQILDQGDTKLAAHDKPLQVGFSGNLLGEAYDREAMRAIIEAYPNCTFHFWGKIKNPDNYIRLGNYHPEFIDFLQSSKNCVVHGIVSSDELAAGLNEMDMLWLIWKHSSHPQWNENTNPHKVMEYLSTGLPVLSHYMTIYKNNKWMYMAKPGATVKEYLTLFESMRQKALQNNEAMRGSQKEQIQFALSHTYELHIKTMEQLISESNIN